MKLVLPVSLSNTSMVATRLVIVRSEIYQMHLPANLRPVVCLFKEIAVESRNAAWPTSDIEQALPNVPSLSRNISSTSRHGPGGTSIVSTTLRRAV